MFDARPIGDQRRPPCRQLPERFRGGIWLPDLWQVLAPEQLGQRLGIDFIGLDLRLGDGFGLHGIANSNPSDVGT